MKLYSKNQLFIITACSMLAASILTIVFFSVLSKKTEPDSESVGQESKDSEFSLDSEKKFDFLQSEDLESEPESLENYTQDEIQNITVYEKCSDAVVNINTQVAGVNWFLEPVVENGGSGSGAIIDVRGYVITNVHVIKNASKIYVSLSDGTQIEAKVVGLDEDSDIAVIKFDPPDGVQLKTISFGDSRKLRVGQKVIAIGNPYGLDKTMTTGIISALGRPVKNSSERIIRNMIQTDSAINPGNSGGPLLDTSGKMIGINTMIYSSSGSSAGIGFAVPSETASRVVTDLLNYGKVRRGGLQVQLVQLTNRIALYAGLEISRGLLVSKVSENGNAEKAGIQGGKKAVRYGSSIIYLGGDVITAINGIPVDSIADYYSILEDKRPGDTVNITIYRNRQSYSIEVVLSE